MRRRAPALIALLVILALLTPYLPSAHPPVAVATASATGWHCDDPPALRWKGEVRGNAISVGGGERTDYVTFTTYDRGVFTIWFEDLTFLVFPVAGVVGFEYHGGSTRELNPLGFQAFIHKVGPTYRLKLATLHFRGTFPGTEQNDPVRDEYVFDTGCDWRP